MVESAGATNRKNVKVERQQTVSIKSSGGSTKPKLDVYHILENLDELNYKAANLKLTRNEYLDALRVLTKSKVEAVTEAKKIFEKRILELNKAHHFDIVNQQEIGEQAGFEVFKRQAELVR